MELADRCALVAGASAGVGAAPTMSLAHEGCDVVLAARTHDALQRAASDITAQAGCREAAISADLSKQAGVPRVYTQAENIDVLVNNARPILAGRLSDVDDPTWREACDLRLFGYIGLSRVAYSATCERWGGRTCSVLGAAVQTQAPAYSCGVSGNAALTAIALSLRRESRRDGTRVVAVGAGLGATEGLRRLERSEVSIARSCGRPATTNDIVDAVSLRARASELRVGHRPHDQGRHLGTNLRTMPAASSRRRFRPTPLESHHDQPRALTTSLT